MSFAEDQSIQNETKQISFMKMSNFTLDSHISKHLKKGLWRQDYSLFIFGGGLLVRV